MVHWMALFTQICCSGILNVASVKWSFTPRLIMSKEILVAWGAVQVIQNAEVCMWSTFSILSKMLYVPSLLWKLQCLQFLPIHRFFFHISHSLFIFIYLCTVHIMLPLYIENSYLPGCCSSAQKNVSVFELRVLVHMAVKFLTPYGG